MSNIFYNIYGHLESNNTIEKFTSKEYMADVNASKCLVKPPGRDDIGDEYCGSYLIQLQNLEFKVKNSEIDVVELRRVVNDFLHLRQHNKLNMAEKKKLKEIMTQSVRHSDNLNLSGNLSLSGVVKAKQYYYEDGTPLQKVVKQKMAVPFDDAGNIGLKPINKKNVLIESDLHFKKPNTIIKSETNNNIIELKYDEKDFSSSTNIYDSQAFNIFTGGRKIEKKDDNDDKKKDNSKLEKYFKKRMSIDKNGKVTIHTGKMNNNIEFNDNKNGVISNLITGNTNFINEIKILNNNGKMGSTVFNLEDKGINIINGVSYINGEFLVIDSKKNPIFSVNNLDMGEIKLGKTIFNGKNNKIVGSTEFDSINTSKIDFKGKNEFQKESLNYKNISKIINTVDKVDKMIMPVTQNSNNSFVYGETQEYKLKVFDFHVDKSFTIGSGKNELSNNDDINDSFFRIFSKINKTQTDEKIIFQYKKQGLEKNISISAENLMNTCENARLFFSNLSEFEIDEIAKALKPIIKDYRDKQNIQNAINN